MSVTLSHFLRMRTTLFRYIRIGEFFFEIKKQKNSWKWNLSVCDTIIVHNDPKGMSWFLGTIWCLVSRLNKFYHQFCNNFLLATMEKLEICLIRNKRESSYWECLWARFNITLHPDRVTRSHTYVQIAFNKEYLMEKKLDY